MFRFQILHISLFRFLRVLHKVPSLTVVLKAPLVRSPNICPILMSSQRALYPNRRTAESTIPLDVPDPTPLATPSLRLAQSFTSMNSSIVLRWTPDLKTRTRHTCASSVIIPWLRHSIGHVERGCGRPFRRFSAGACANSPFTSRALGL